MKYGDIIFAIIVVGLMLGFAAFLFLLATPEISENRHIMVKDKCCNLDNECFIFDTNGIKYTPVRAYYETDENGNKQNKQDIYRYMEVGKSYTVRVHKMRFYPTYIEKALVDNPRDLTCEAKGLKC